MGIFLLLNKSQRRQISQKLVDKYSHLFYLQIIKNKMDIK